jgi:hypothetical protein
MSASDNAAAVPDEEGLQKLRDVVAAIKEEDFAQVSLLCKTLLDENRSDSRVVHDLSTVLWEAHIVALLQCERYDEVASIVSIVPAEGSGRLRALQAYAIYKQKQYQTIVQQEHLVDDKNDDDDDASRTFLRHLHAQSLHHLSDGARSIEAYMDMIQSKATNPVVDDDMVQLWTNLLAAWIANHTTPYCLLQQPAISDNGSNKPVILQRDKLVAVMLQYLDGKNKSNSSSDDNNYNVDYPYDLAYNLATLQLLTTTKASERLPWLDLLNHAILACRRSTAELDVGDQLSELNPLTTNQALFQRAYWSLATRSDVANSIVDVDSSKSGSSLLSATALQLVHRMNRALGLSSTPAEALDALASVSESNVTSTLTSLQRRIWFYNIAVLQLQAARYDDCKSTCRVHFLSSTTTSALKNGKKKKATTTAATTTSDTVAAAATTAPRSNTSNAYASAEDQLFWECRATVLVSRCAEKGPSPDGSTTVALALLDECIERVHAAPPSPVRDQCLAFVLVHQAALQSTATVATAPTDAQSNIKLLESLPLPLSEKPAVIATKAALYQLSGNDAMAAQMLKTNGRVAVGKTPNDLAVADFAMSQGKHAEAAALYEAIVKRNATDASAKARWVRALSYIDPEKAVHVWSSMTPNLVAETNDQANAAGLISGAELEARELRLKSAMIRKSGDGVNAGNALESTKKSREAIMRRRARQREAYLAEQEQKGAYKPGSTPPPDPERWIPKYERSNARRRRNRGQHHGSGGGGGGAHQGGASEKEAAKLDIVARQAARAAGEDPSTNRSTAHLTVSSSGAVGGGARKGKSGKRR